MEFDGQTINWPPLFKGEKYDYLKLRMTTSFLEFNNVDLLKVIKKCTSSLLDFSSEISLTMILGMKRRRHYINLMPKLDTSLCALYLKTRSLKFML